MLLFHVPLANNDTTPQIQIYAEDREQFQRHVNPTFSDAVNKNRSDLYSRLRIGANVKLSSQWSGRAY
jgi:hypothetical protein